MNELYTYEWAKNSAVNLIWGQRMFTHHGTCTVKQTETGAYAKCKINSCQGLFMKDKDKCAVNCEVFAPDATEPSFKITGTWISHLDLHKRNPQTGEWEDPVTIYRQFPVNGDDDTRWDEIYRMSDIALCLNQIDDELAAKLPPTDSRFRPDMRAMEEGDYE